MKYKIRCARHGWERIEAESVYEAEKVAKKRECKTLPLKITLEEIQDEFDEPKVGFGHGPILPSDITSR